LAEYSRTFYENLAEVRHSSAQEVVPLILGFLTPASVVDVGCGTGTWLAEFRRRGVSDILGIDGPWIDRDVLEIPQERFLQRDLTTRLVLGRNFDLAISLEVGEHLPASAARGYVGSLTQLAPVVLFAAAIPGQGGMHHVNEQWPTYWTELFLEHAFQPVDIIRPPLWMNPRVAFWYRQNLVFFADRARLDEYPALRTGHAATGGRFPPLVHPELYELQGRGSRAPGGARGALRRGVRGLRRRVRGMLR
jgi:SAM-dependent methyltransferase